jgi:hypothetical protein
VTVLGRTSVPCFRSERFVCCTAVAGGWFKLAQLIFQRRDGSIYLTFPYFEHQVGLVSVATMLPGSDQLNLKPRGKVTSHVVSTPTIRTARRISPRAGRSKRSSGARRFPSTTSGATSSPFT